MTGTLPTGISVAGAGNSSDGKVKRVNFCFVPGQRGKVAFVSISRVVVSRAGISIQNR
jgi:hypothetical protein